MRRRDRYLVTTDKSRLDLRVIQGFLRRSYWAAGIPSEVVERSIRNSLAFGHFYNEDHLARSPERAHRRRIRRTSRPS
jgi:hypothetical protein